MDREGLDHAAEVTPGSSPSRAHRSLITGLGLRLVGPYLVYSLLQSRLHDDLVALAVSAAIPIVVGGFVAVRHRRLDGVLALSALSLVVSLAIAAAIGHGTTIVKLRGAVAPTVLGLTLLVLAVGPAPLRRRALLALRGMARKRAERAGRAPPPPIGHTAARHLRLLLLVWGVGLLVVAAAHATIVFTVSTSDYLVASRASSLGILAVLILITRRLGFRRGQMSPGAPTSASPDPATAGGPAGRPDRG